MDARCPRCRHEHARTVYDYGDARIVRCDRCTLMFLDPWPDVDHGKTVYNDTYFRNTDFFDGRNSRLYGYADYIAERFNKQPQFARIAREIRSLLNTETRTPRLLEVGCGLGYFLEEAFEEGFEPVGIEFNESAVDRLQRKYAFKIMSGALEDIPLEAGEFDAVAMFDVIEHLRDPFQCLDKLHRALKPGGLLVVSTPDSGSFMSRLIGSRLEDFRRTREHLFFFSQDTLSDMLAEHGFELLRIRSIGHTFALGFLLDRLGIYNRFAFSALRRMVSAIGLEQMQIHLNPHTKMIAIARRREPAKLPAGERPGHAAPIDVRTVIEEPPRPAPSEVNQTLIDELNSLETNAGRHYQWVFDLIAPHLGRSVLEVGSGTGVISKFLLARGYRLTLTDHQPIYLEKLRDRFGTSPHVEYELLDLSSPPFRCGDRPDTVVCLNVLEHVDADEAALAGIAEVLGPGGSLILQVPNHPFLFGSLDHSYGHRRRYTARDLTAKLERAGFRVKYLQPFNPLSVPGWFFMSRVLRAPRLHAGSLKLYDRLVPLLRRLQPSFLPGGLSLVVMAECTRDTRAAADSPLQRAAG